LAAKGQFPLGLMLCCCGPAWAFVLIAVILL